MNTNEHPLKQLGSDYYDTPPTCDCCGAVAPVTPRVWIDTQSTTIEPGTVFICNESPICDHCYMIKSYTIA